MKNNTIILLLHLFITCLVYSSTSCMHNEKPFESPPDQLTPAINGKPCNNTDTLIKIEIGYGNWFYFPKTAPWSDRFAELMWKKHSIIVTGLYDNGSFDSCFAVQMNKLTIERIGLSTIQKTMKEADSINTIFSEYLNLDSSHKYALLTPNYPGGQEFLDDELFIEDDSIYCNTEIWLDGIIDTNGHVVNIEIIRNGSINNTKKLMNKLTNHMLPFTPAFILASNKIANNPVIVKYKKIRFKQRFVAKVVKPNSVYPKHGMSRMLRILKTDSSARTNQNQKHLLC